MEHYCIVCGRKLKNPQSIRDKMGSTCKKRLISIAKNEVVKKQRRKKETRIPLFGEGLF